MRALYRAAKVIKEGVDDDPINFDQLTAPLRDVLNAIDRSYPYLRSDSDDSASDDYDDKKLINKDVEKGKGIRKKEKERTYKKERYALSKKVKTSKASRKRGNKPSKGIFVYYTFYSNTNIGAIQDTLTSLRRSDRLKNKAKISRFYAEMSEEIGMTEASSDEE